MTKTVTVDGPAGSGKSSIAKALAKKINFQHLESGALYRAITHYFLAEEIGWQETEKIKEALLKIKLSVKEGNILVDENTIPSESLHSEEIDKNVAQYAQIGEVRNVVRGVQQEIATKSDTVVEGRDIGSEVFSSAFCKFYLDANLETRVLRRHKEALKKSENSTVEDVRKEMIERDKLDSTRTVSPLRIPPDAYIINTTALSEEEVLEAMVRYFEKKKKLTELSFADMLNNDRADEGKEQVKTFEQAIDAYDKNSSNEGQILKGKIISIDKEIFVDLGGKMDAYISDRETEYLERQNLKIGDEISVMTVGKSSRGTIISKTRADIEAHKVKVEESYKNGEPVHGIVKRYIEGKGFQISLYGVRAFCPEDEYDVRGFNPQKQKNRKGLFLVEEFSPKQILLSRKKVVEKSQNENRKSFYETVRENDVIEVRAVSIKSHGVIVEAMPGVISLLRNKEISWKRFDNISDEIKQGEKFMVKITSVDYENMRMEISKKQTEDDPFNVFIEKVKKNDVVKGKVVQLERFGAFVDIYPGVDGLLHISDISWKRNIEHPSELIKKGQEIEVLILNIDTRERRVRLGFKQLLENPWDAVEKTYPANSVVDALVTHVTENVAYCLVGESIEGEVYFKNSPYKNEPSFDFSKVVKIGDSLRVRVIQINRKHRKLELEMKKTFDDPWQDISENYGENGVLEGEVVEFIEKGANIKVNDDVTGFCHVSQIAETVPEKMEDALKIGEKYSFCVQFIDIEKKKLTLSRKNYLESRKKSGKNNYSANEKHSGTITLGEFIKDE